MIIDWLSLALVQRLAHTIKDLQRLVFSNAEVLVELAQDYSSSRSKSRPTSAFWIRVMDLVETLKAASVTNFVARIPKNLTADLFNSQAGQCYSIHF